MLSRTERSIWTWLSYRENINKSCLLQVIHKKRHSFCKKVNTTEYDTTEYHKVHCYMHVATFCHDTRKSYSYHSLTQSIVIFH
jgi:hypothetical protein